MGEEYKLGNVTFDSAEERDAASKEKYYFSVIKKKYNLNFNDTETAKRIINMLEPSGVIRTKLGRRMMVKLYSVANIEPTGEEDWVQIGKKYPWLSDETLEVLAHAKKLKEIMARMQEEEVEEDAAIEETTVIAGESDIEAEESTVDEAPIIAVETDIEVEESTVDEAPIVADETDIEIEESTVDETSIVADKTDIEAEKSTVDEAPIIAAETDIEVEELSLNKPDTKAISDEIVTEADNFSNGIEKEPKITSSEEVLKEKEMLGILAETPKSSKKKNSSNTNGYFISTLCLFALFLVVIFMVIIKLLPVSIAFFTFAVVLVGRECIAIAKTKKINKLEDALHTKYRKNESNVGEEFIEGAKGLSLRDIYVANLNHEEFLKDMDASGVDLLNPFDCFKWGLTTGDATHHNLVMTGKERSAFGGNIDRIPETKNLETQGVHIKKSLDDLSKELQINVSYRMMPDNPKYDKLNSILDYFGKDYDIFFSMGLIKNLENELFDGQKIENEWSNEGDLYKRYKRKLSPYSIAQPTIDAILATTYYQDCYNIKSKLEYINKHLPQIADDITKKIATLIYGRDADKCDLLHNRLLGELIVKDSDLLIEYLGDEQKKMLEDYKTENKKLVSHPFEFKIGTSKALRALILHTYYVAEDKILVDVQRLHKIVSVMLMIASIISGILLL